MATATLALLILGAILLQVVAALLYHLFRHRSQPSTPSADTSTVAPPSPITPAATMAGGWEGYREFTVARRVVEDGLHSVCSFYLTPADGQPLPPFLPGQFLTFQLSIPDPHTHEPKQVVRCYSLSDAPRPDHYRITVKRVPAPPDRPDLPPGLSSNYLHETVQEGQSLQVRAPSGHFHLIEKEPLPLVLIAGGIGITPMLSILTTLLQRGSPRDVWLFYGVRNGAELVMGEMLQGLAAQHPNFHLHLCYSAPAKGESEGMEFQHRGRVDIPLLRSTLKLARYQFYVCGPRAMMESIVPGLQEWGVATGDIFYESFGPASLQRHEPAAAATAATPSASVTFRRSGRTLVWKAGSSLLELAEDNDIDVPSGCRAGSCGSCQTALLSGMVEYAQEPDAEIEPDHCLLCIGTPKGDITLDA